MVMKITLGPETEIVLAMEALVQEVLEKMMKKERAELMVLSLMDAYSFSCPKCKELLVGKLISSDRSFDLNSTNCCDRA